MARLLLVDGPLPNLKVEVYDATYNEKLLDVFNYVPGKTREIIYTGKEYYLDYESPSTKLMIKVYSNNLLVKRILPDTIVDTTPTSSLLLDWTEDLKDNYQEGHKKSTYFIYQRDKDNPEGYLKAFTPNNATQAVADFSSYTSSTINDTEGNPLFSYRNMYHAVGGPLGTDMFNGSGDAVLHNDTLEFFSTTGFVLRCIFEKYFKFESDRLNIEALTDTGAVSISVNDGATTITNSFENVSLEASSSIDLLVLSDRLVLVLNGSIEEAFVVYFDELKLLPLAITSFDIYCYGIAAFSVDNASTTIDSMSTAQNENRPRLIGTTSATQFLLREDMITGNYRDSTFLVTGVRMSGALDADCFTRSFLPQDLVILPGNYCLVWDNFLSAKVDYSGLSFYVRSKDYEDSLKGANFELNTDLFTRVIAPVNNFGYFGVYLPWDVIYTVGTQNRAHKFRFIVPRKNEVRFRDVADFYNENRYYS